MEKYGMILQARRPHAVQRLPIPVPAAVGHIDHGGLFARGAGVGHRAAQEQQLIVLVGGNGHQVDFFGKGLPLLHGVLGYTRRQMTPQFSPPSTKITALPTSGVKGMASR